jgi:hypothetical protein
MINRAEVEQGPQSIRELSAAFRSPPKAKLHRREEAEIRSTEEKDQTYLTTAPRLNMSLRRVT